MKNRNKSVLVSLQLKLHRGLSGTPCQSGLLQIRCYSLEYPRAIQSKSAAGEGSMPFLGPVRHIGGRGYFLGKSFLGKQITAGRGTLTWVNGRDIETAG